VRGAAWTGPRRFNGGGGLTDKLLIKTGRNYHFVNKNDIHFIESERNYARIYCENRTYLVKRSLGFLEEKLGEDKFMRVNRSALVNVERIHEMKEEDNNNYIIILNNNKVLRWGRRYRERLVKLSRI